VCIGLEGIFAVVGFGALGELREMETKLDRSCCRGGLGRCVTVAPPWLRVGGYRAAEAEIVLED